MALREWLAIGLAVFIALTILALAPRVAAQLQASATPLPVLTTLMLAAHRYVVLLPVVVIALLVGDRRRPARRGFTYLAYVLCVLVLAAFVGGAWLPNAPACAQLC